MIFDVLFVVFLGGGFYQGYRKGLIYALFSLFAYFLGIIGALKFSHLIISFLHTSLRLGPGALSVVAFILMFLMIVLLVRIVAWTLEQILRTFSLNVANQLAGGVVFSLIALYLLGVMIWFMNIWGVFPDHQKMTSHVYPYIANLGPAVAGYTGRVLPLCRTAFHDIDVLIRK